MTRLTSSFLPQLTNRGPSAPTVGKGQPSKGLNSARFNRSGGLRFSMWEEAIVRLPETPWGAGPGSVRALGLNSQGPDISNEALQYVVERGVIGLFGLLVLWWALVRLTPRGTAARAIVIAYMFGEIFRETLHYRHLWIFLAIALVSAEQAQRRADECHDEQDRLRAGRPHQAQEHTK